MCVRACVCERERERKRTSGMYELKTYSSLKGCLSVCECVCACMRACEHVCVREREGKRER